MLEGIEHPRVPKALKSAYNAISEFTDTFCARHLDAEYLIMSRELTAELCRKRPSPLLRGDLQIWAAAIVGTLARVNFLHDKSFEPFMSLEVLSERLGVKKSTLSNKIRMIMDLLCIVEFEPRLTVPSLWEMNPHLWFIEYNGFVVDMRIMPRSIQQAAVDAGMIPFVPGTSAESEAGKADSIAAQPLAAQNNVAKPSAQPPLDLTSGNVLQIKIHLLDSKPAIWRRILVTPSTTLYELHCIIQIAMGWYNSHLFQFMIENTRIGLPDPDFQDDDLIDSSAVTIRSLLKKFPEIRKFHYTYDFGDDWRHEIIVEKSVSAEAGKTYPLCIAGKLRCPLEDSGGIHGYENLQTILNDTRHPEHAEMKEWASDFSDPGDFDIEQANEGLANLKSYIKDWERFRS